MAAFLSRRVLFPTWRPIRTAGPRRLIQARTHRSPTVNPGGFPQRAAAFSGNAFQVRIFERSHEVLSSGCFLNKINGKLKFGRRIAIGGAYAEVAGSRNPGWPP